MRRHSIVCANSEECTAKQPCTVILLHWVSGELRERQACLCDGMDSMACARSKDPSAR